jgi:phosphoribosyl 1,2-cyclic phosphodiesterase
MSKGTANFLKIDDNKIMIVDTYTTTNIKKWRILPFKLAHDAVEPLGFLIGTPNGKKIVYATDTAYIIDLFKNVTHYMIECNYAEKLLKKNTDLTSDVKARIRTSHFELENVKDFFKKQDLSKTEKIYLIHLSNENSDADSFSSQIKRITGKPVYIA